jgi:predicted AlkP superfamily phosphohydrolase/phosphomutase
MTDTAVLVVSDHGAQPLMGGICINEWLMANGYLTLKEPPTEVLCLDQAAVDWSQTQVWGAGGYYARIFLNVQGREPQGICGHGRLRIPTGGTDGEAGPTDGSRRQSHAH